MQIYYRYIIRTSASFYYYQKIIKYYITVWFSLVIKCLSIDSSQLCYYIQFYRVGTSFPNQNFKSSGSHPWLRPGILVAFQLIRDQVVPKMWDLISQLWTLKFRQYSYLVYNRFLEIGLNKAGKLICNILNISSV